MKNIAVIFGGRSVEHDISIITAQQVLASISKGYNVIPIYIAPSGDWFIAENLDNPKTFLDFSKNVRKKKSVSLLLGSPHLIVNSHLSKKIRIDCALLCLHGKNGEDGSVQGLCQLCQIPFSSCAMMQSAIGMDKAVTKRLLSSYKIKNAKFVEFYKRDFEENKEAIIKDAIAKIGLPIIVKPANLGSSVGISVCEREEQLETMIEEALLYDNKILLEEFLQNAREFSCAVLSLGGKHIASKVQEVKKGEIYTFEEKYLHRLGKEERKPDKAIDKKIKDISICTYKALDFKGVVRIDFLMSEKGEIYVNEVNTIPGSLSFNLFEVPFHDLIDALIDEAIASFENMSNFTYKFSSQALKDYCTLANNFKFKK